MMRVPGFLLVLLFSAAAVILACRTVEKIGVASEPFRPPTPLGLDVYFPVPTGNPLTGAKVELGRRLFFDPILSADGRVSCSSCHRPEHAFSDTVAVSPGVFGREGNRNAPTVLNVAYGRFFFWDGRATTLEEQVVLPIQNPKEMDMSLDDVVQRLRQHTEYDRAFQQALGEGASSTNLARALASYLRMLRSGDAPIDRYYSGDTDALSRAAQRGFRLFIGRADCTACHLGPTFSDQKFHNTGVSWGSGDLGRYTVTGVEEDRGAFKTPTLRNVAETAPYMHDGSIGTLEEVIEFYTRGGKQNPHLDPEIRRIDLTHQEKQALLEFLHALSGTQ